MTSQPTKITRAGSSHPKLDQDSWLLFQEHFALFPWSSLPDEAIGFELGCGDGLWASLVAQWAGRLHCIESRPGLVERARDNLHDAKNCEIHAVGFDALPLDEASMDFGYSIATLQQIPDPGGALRQAVGKLKPGAPMMVYLIYALDNRPAWFRAIWQLSDILRRTVAGQPEPVRRKLTDAIAFGVYLPLARAAARVERLGLSVERIPLSPYRGSTIETMREAAWERFANASEQRFTRDEIRSLMRAAGLERISFLEEPPFWTALGYRPS